MAIEKMEKIRLMAVSSQRDELLREMMLLGCVEILEPAALPENEILATLTRFDGAELYRCKTDYAVLSNGIKQLDKYASEKKKFLSPLPEAAMEELLDETTVPECLETAEKLNALDEQIRRIAADESRERAAIESLRPWEALTLPLDCKGTERAAAIPGTLPASVQLADAEAALSEATGLAQIVPVSADNNLHYVVLVCLREQQEEVLAALRPVEFSVMRLGEGKGTARESIAASEAKLAGYAAKKEALAAKIAAEAPRRAEMQLRADTISTKIARAEAASRLLCTESTFLFQGWLPVSSESGLTQVLSKYDCAWETEAPDPEKPAEVPIKLRSNRLTRPYTMITEMYSLPAYNGVDPNPFIMPFFSLFFGIMFADMAYGSILLILGLLITFKKKPKGTLGYMAGLLIQCGITTIIFGFFTGGFFGNAVPTVGGIFGKTWAVVPTFATLHIGSIASIDLPLKLLEGNNPLFVLIGAMCIGVVHLFIGVCISIYMQFREGKGLDALLNEASWWIMFAGLALKIFGIGTVNGIPVVLAIGALMMVVGAVKGGKGFGRVTAVFSAVYGGVTGYLGDILSYSRLMALMLAGSVIASVFNQLGALGGIWLFIPVFLIGHALNFGLNLIGCFVHTMRLHFLEFFGKWYRDGGRPFRPLAVQTKFVDIKED